MKPTVRPPETCANCGTDIPGNASACPGCGADERTGWREASIYDGLDLPGDPEQATKPTSDGIVRRWWIVAVALVLLLALAMLGLRLG